MKRIRISDEALCAAANECCNQKNRKKWIEDHDLFVGSDGRAYALVDTPTRVYFQDAITGGLVEHGRILSGEREVHSFVRNKRKATQILMEAFMEELA
jgi:hypothetical protein